MGALIFMVLMAFIFILSVPILTVSLIFLIRNIRKKNTKKRISLIVSIVGTVIGSILFLMPVGVVIFLRTMNTSTVGDTIKTNNEISWQRTDDNEKYFMYGDRIYKRLTVESAWKSNGVKTDTAIANIPPEYQDNITDFLFGKEPGDIVYTIKNHDDSLLLVGTGNDLPHSLFCDERIIKERIEYYHNLNNYNYYISFNDTGREEDSSVIQDRLNIEKIYFYTGEQYEFDRIDFTYMSVFGISNDGIMHKYLMTLFIADDDLFRKDLETRLNNDKHTITGTRLPEELKASMLELFTNKY